MINSLTTTRARWGRRTKSLLAGGLVLGVGAAITLAAWNDSEFASAEFEAGSFDMVGSIDGANFANHPTGTPAALSFSAGFDNLSPDTTVSAPFVLHLTPTTTFDAEVELVSAVGAGTAETNLTYGIQQVASVAACTPTAVGIEIVPAGTALDAVTDADTFDLAQSVDGTAAGADAFLCFQVTAGPALTQGTGATGVWEFVATSVV